MEGFDSGELFMILPHMPSGCPGKGLRWELTKNHETWAGGRQIKQLGDKNIQIGSSGRELICLLGPCLVRSCCQGLNKRTHVQT